MAYNPVNGFRYVANIDSDTVSVIEPIQLPLAEIISSGNNINVQLQENTGNDAGGQLGNGNSHSDENIFQGQSVNQDSSVVS